MKYTERFAFDHLWNGLSISMDPTQAPKLARLTAASQIFPITEVALPENTASDPELFTALAMTGADIAQSELGFTGAGVKVAVMDSGIDIDHPAFGGGGVPGGTAFPSARVAYGYDFVGDDYDGRNAPVPDNNPDDCGRPGTAGGHGTHVAGIAGANDPTNGMKGVAPDVTFGAYRVFGCDGSTSADIMIAAMERARADGMQVLNMSIGSAYQWPQYPTAMAATRLVNKGVVVVASIGNSGARGLYSAGAPGVGEKVIGVASFINSANPTDGIIASSSSYGLSPDLSIKPDIGAPGGLIYSSYPIERGGYRTISGTSMASPHVAGAAALLLQARPKTPAQAVGGILQNSADPKPFAANPALGLYSVHRQGAGMVDIDDAILSTTKVEPAKLSLGESEAGPAVRTIEVTNSAATAVTYDLSSVNAVSTGANTSTPEFATSDASVAFSLPSVTVPANGTVTVDVTITAPTGPDKGIYGGYVVLTPQTAGQVYRVPFGGFVGDYQSIQVLTPTFAGFPWLARVQGGGIYNTNPPATFTMTGGDFPYVAAYFAHPAREAKVEVFDAVTGKSWKTAWSQGYLPRNVLSTGIFAFGFDGTTTAGGKTYTVPDGSYVLKLSVLKALGDSSNPAHWEIWTSPAFTIDRP